MTAFNKITKSAFQVEHWEWKMWQRESECANLDIKQHCHCLTISAVVQKKEGIAASCSEFVAVNDIEFLEVNPPAKG